MKVKDRSQIAVSQGTLLLWSSNRPESTYPRTHPARRRHYSQEGFIGTHQGCLGIIFRRHKWRGRRPGKKLRRRTLKKLHCCDHAGCTESLGDPNGEVEGPVDGWAERHWRRRTRQTRLARRRGSNDYYEAGFEHETTRPERIIVAEYICQLWVSMVGEANYKTSCGKHFTINSTSESSL